MNAKKNEVIDPSNYVSVLERIKTDIQQSQLRAAISVTKELTMLYWRIGKMLSQRTAEEGWGARTLENLAKDLKAAFPNVSGFSFRNIKYMRQFAQVYSDENRAAAAAQIPWGHNMVILDRVEDNAQKMWYIQQTIENGWSRSMLQLWVDSDLYAREGKAVNNFKHTPASSLAFIPPRSRIS